MKKTVLLAALRLRVHVRACLGTASGRLQAECAQHPERPVPLHLPRQPGHVPRRRAGCPEGDGPAGSWLRDEQGARTASGTSRPRRRSWASTTTRSRSTAPWWRTRRRGRSSGPASTTAGSKSRIRTADYYTLKNVPHGQVRQRWYYSTVTGAVAPRLRLHAARLRHEYQGEVPRALPAARLGRERAGLACPGARRRDHGQPDRGEEGQAHDHRHGQPQCREAGRERRALRRARGASRRPCPSRRRPPGAAAAGRGAAGRGGMRPLGSRRSPR